MELLSPEQTGTAGHHPTKKSKLKPCKKTQQHGGSSKNEHEQIILDVNIKFSKFGEFALRYPSEGI